MTRARTGVTSVETARKAIPGVKEILGPVVTPMIETIKKLGA